MDPALKQDPKTESRSFEITQFMQEVAGRLGQVALAARQDRSRPPLARDRPGPPGLARPAVEASLLPSRWLRFPVRIREDVTFSVTVDPEMTDPQTVALCNGAGESLEAEAVGIMLEVAGRDDLVVDVGAGLGFFSLAAAAAGCRVLAVEADPGRAALLQDSTIFNRFPQVTVVEAAALASDSAKVKDLLPQAPPVAVDDLAAELMWGSIRLIRIACPRSLDLVVDGLERILKEQAPALLCRVNAALPEHDKLRHLLAHLKSFGYSAYAAHKGRLVPAPPGAGLPGGFAEIAAFKHFPMSLADRIDEMVSPAETGEEHDPWR